MTPVAALVIPSPPMLLPEYVGLADPAAELRHRVTQALREAVDRHAIEHVVVVTGHERAPRHTKGPVGARVAHAIVTAAGWDGPVATVVVPFDATPQEVAACARSARSVGMSSARVLLVVAADLSAKRTEKAPGHFDERALAVDTAVLAALENGCAPDVSALDPAVCADLWLTGRAALQVLALLLPQPGSARVLWADLPYGVQLVLATWSA